MIIYSVRVEISADVHEEWLAWMKSKHIPDVLATGFFEFCQVGKILSPAPESGSVGYVLEYVAESLENYERYQAECAPALQAEYKQRYDGHFAASRTLREIVEL